MTPHDEERVIKHALRTASLQTAMASWRQLWPTLLAAFLLVLAIGVGWALRWQVVHADRDVTVLLNRWTGEIRAVVGLEWHPVKQAAP